MRFSLLGPIFLALSPMVAAAQPADPAAARAQLQEGYRLKQAGHCDEAIPHLEESVRLDPQPKNLLNLAECEEKLGKLANAQAHLVQARDLAGAANLQAYRDLAVQRLQGLERRMPKLAVKLALDAPLHSGVTRDGAELGQVSLGMPLPIDPGKHTVVARGGGFERTYNIVLVEGETKELEVTPIGDVPPAGPPIESSKSDSIAPAPPVKASQARTTATAATSDPSTESTPNGAS